MSSTMETAMRPDPAADAALGEAMKPVLERRQKMEEGVMRRLQDADTRSDALKPPELEPVPQMEHVEATPPEQRWGSIAMTVAAMAGALTRQPLTASLNAMAQVNEAYNKGDMERAQQAYREWQTQSQNALKINEFRQKAYDDALKKIDSDRHGALGDLQALSAAFKDDMMTQLLATGHVREALNMVHAGSAANAKLAEYQVELQRKHDAIIADRAAHPDLYANPVTANKRMNAIDKGKDPDDEKPETGAQRETDLQNDYVKEQEAKFRASPANAGKEPTAEQRLTWFNEGKTLGKPKTATAARMERFNDLAAEDFRREFKRDPNSDDSGDRVQMERYALGEEAKAKLASSPYMQNLQHLEKEAVDRAIERDPSLATDLPRLGRVINQVSGRKALTDGQLVAIQDHAQRVTNALDDIDKLNQGLSKATAVAGGLGPLLRGGEAIENITGYLPSSERALFRAALSRLQYDAPALLSYRPTGVERTPSPLIEDIISNQHWGDTYSNVTSRLAALQERFVGDLRTLDNEYQGGAGQRLPMLRPQQGTAPTAGTAGTAASGSAPAAAPPAVGEVYKGYRYKGGDRSDPKSWEKVDG